MFGGIAFLVNGSICVGVDRNDLDRSLREDALDKLLARKGSHPRAALAVARRAFGIQALGHPKPDANSGPR
jgi:hypothetical protein